jgi:hypothetical protein
MEVCLVQDENEIALAYCRSVEAICPVQPDVRPFGFTLKLVTSQPVDLQSLRIIESFLAGKYNKPMIAREARWPAFPYLPLMEIHRSGFCRTLLMADSSATRSLSGP